MSVNLNQCHYFWQGKKVVLRPFRPDDWKTLHLEECDSEAKRVCRPGVPLPQSEQEVKTWVEDLCKEHTDSFFFAIESLKGEFVGTASLHSRNAQNGTFSYTVYIFKGNRRKGYALDAVRMLLKYGFYELRMQKANSETIETNIAFIKLHEAMGFQVEGRRRSNVYTNGFYYDEVLFGMTREEFDVFEKRYRNRG